MPPMPAEWWLRPVSSACRVGEHRAVVWKRLYFRPPAASLSAVGVWQGPPKALRRAEAGIVDEDDQHVGRALGRAQLLDRRKLGVRVLRVVGDQLGRAAYSASEDGNGVSCLVSS